MGPPVLLVNLFTTEARDQILDRLRVEPRAPGTEVYLGTYSIDDDDAAAIESAAIPGVQYAPTLHLAPAENARLRERRRLSDEEASKLDQEFAGELPVASDKRLPAEKQRAWGVELGKRFRDEIRKAQSRGVSIGGWQLDEIFGECRLRNTPNAFRMFVGGVIRGVAVGRPKLGDELKPGFVWIAKTALEALPGIPLTSDVPQFWQDVGLGAKHLVGEEYVSFAGDAVQAGRDFAKLQTALASSKNGDCRALAERYIVGMSPGWQIRNAKTGQPSGLGGNIHRLTDDVANEWRRDFIASRTGARKPAGYGQFFFAGEFNTQPRHLEDAIESLHFAALMHAEP